MGPGAALAIGAGISAASSIFGGISSSRAARAQADRARQFANYNAAMQIEWGRQQATAIAAASMFNMQMALMANQFNKAATEKISSYNADLIRAVSEYNAKVYEYKTAEVYDALELDQLLVHNEARQQQGSAIAQYAASGVIIDEGSPATVLADMRTQEELTKFILEHNADTEVTNLLNAAAKSRWEGEAEARRILFEGRMATIGMDINTAAQMGMYAADGMMQTINVQNSAYMRSVEIMSQGLQQMDNLNYDASRYMFNGILGGIKEAAQGYLAYSYYKVPESPALSEFGSYSAGYKFPGSSGTGTGGAFSNFFYGQGGPSGFAKSISSPGTSLLGGF